MPAPFEAEQQLDTPLSSEKAWLPPMSPAMMSTPGMRDGLDVSPSKRTRRCTDCCPILLFVIGWGLVVVLLVNVALKGPEGVSECLNPDQARTELVKNVLPYMADIKSSVLFITLSFVASIMIASLILGMLRCCSAAAIWLGLVVPAGLAVYLGYVAQSQAASLAADYELSEGTYQALGILMYILGAAVLISAILSFRAIGTAASMVGSVQTFVRDVRSSMVVAYFAAFAQLVLLLGFASMLGSVGCTWRKTARGTSEEQLLLAGAAITIIMWLWTAGALHALSRYALAYMVGEWYFAPITANSLLQNMRVNLCDVSYVKRALGSGCRYHFGTMLTAALAGPPVAVGRGVMRWVAPVVGGAAERPAVAVVDAALVKCALSGTGLGASMRESVDLALRNREPMRAGLRAGTTICMVGRLLTTGLVTVAAWVVLTYIRLPYPLLLDPISDPIAPTVTCAILALIVGDTLFLPFTIAAQAMMYCFAVDMEMGYYRANPELQSFVEKTCPPKSYASGSA